MDRRDELKRIRKSLGMTQEEFAQHLELNRGTIASMEIGRRPISLVYIFAARYVRDREASKQS